MMPIFENYKTCPKCKKDYEGYEDFSFIAGQGMCVDCYEDRNTPNQPTNNLEGDEIYDRFIKRGLFVGFTDDQIDFLWDYLYMISKQYVK